MDISQAQQEIQRLYGLYQAQQISPEAYVQAVNQLQISDASGAFWHVDGATLKWYWFDGQTWVEQPAPAAAPPSMEPPFAPPAGPAGTAPMSLVPLWIGLGALGIIVIVGVVVLLSGFNPFAAPAPTATPVLSATAPATPRPPTVTIAVSATAAPTLTPTTVVSPTLVPTLPRTATATVPAATRTVTVPLVTRTATLPSAVDFLRPGGPWLLALGSDSLDLIQPGQTLSLNTEKWVGPDSIDAIIAPKGGHAAYITSAAGDGIHGLKLTIYDVAAKKAEKVLPLTSAKTEPSANARPGDPAFEAIRSIIDVTSLAWSPDGKQLAFVSVQDGPSSDLYLYSLDTQKVTRLTDGPSQAFAPSWSPDGKYIVQFGAASFGTGAGYTMLGAWATRAADGVSTLLYTPASGGEIGLGWADANTFLVYSFNAGCGYHNLRKVSIQPLKVSPLVSGCFNDVAFDAASGMILLGVNQSTADFCSCGTKVSSGLYLVKMDASLTRLSPASVERVAWVQNAGVGWGMTEKGEVLTFTAAGKALTLPAGAAKTAPVAGTGGKTWAWASSQLNNTPGLWLGAPDGAAQKVIDTPVIDLVWTSNGQAVLFISSSRLYVAFAPGFKAQPLVDGVPAGKLGWVNP